MIGKISFIIPCYRSERTIEDVVGELTRVMSERPETDYEIIMVCDGSPDGVWRVISELAAADGRLKGINLFKNFGQINAQMAGLNHASGDVCVFLDDDGQCPADKLWRLVAPLESGYDVSVAKYPKKQQSGFKNFGSALNRAMASWLLELPEGFVMSNFFAMTRLMAREVCRYKNPYPYFTGLVFRITRNVASVEMSERERASGTTGYSFKKLLALWLNGFTNFSIKPLRIASITGMCVALAGFIWGAVLVLRKLINPAIILAGYASVVACMLFIGGIMMVMLGLIGEYIGRMFICMNNSPQYAVHDTLNLGEANDIERE